MMNVATRDWATVDGAVDPGAYVGYLDVVQSHDGVHAYKQQTYELLGLRSGHQILDVGCGTGDDAMAMSRLVAPLGRVVGIDSSLTMVEEARRRSDGYALPVEFRTGDAHDLDFPDETFDGVRADRVFQHLEDSSRALAEMVRVTKRGGRVVVADTDWGTLAIDGPDRKTTRAVLDAIEAGIRNPWMGRDVFGLFRKIGLEEVVAFPITALLTDYTMANNLFSISDGVQRARDAGDLSSDEAAHWARWIAETSATGRFCCALTLIMVVGRRLR
jgi:ubiquinone/menaquinone biosynthesis C-methylase UbiE